ncbi:sensor domain-containing protein [Nonomuraea sp. SYSU D8015]|uniref:sensor domain-containing protein n=1 Tax=Nonomuraea sp. SYSU D8015 TaxID=2593644 RepID=UPI0016607EE3|nr:sensor domain-containing protein [Nonomuraea sp. SYSU D8015]
MRTLQRLLTDTRYVLLGLPMAVMSFSIVVVGVSAGLGAAVAFVGLPVLAATAALTRNLADVERVALPGVLGHPVARPRYAPAPAGAGWFRRLMNPILNGQAWLDLLHGIVAFPFALLSFVLTTVWWAGAVAGLTFPLYGWIIARIPGVELGWPEWLGLPDNDLAFVVVNTAAGLAFALTLVPVVRLAALLKAGVAQAMLTRAADPEPAPSIYAETAWLVNR